MGTVLFWLAVVGTWMLLSLIIGSVIGQVIKAGMDSGREDVEGEARVLPYRPRR